MSPRLLILCAVTIMPLLTRAARANSSEPLVSIWQDSRGATAPFVPGPHGAATFADANGTLWAVADLETHQPRVVPATGPTDHIVYFDQENCKGTASVQTPPAMVAFEPQDGTKRFRALKAPTHHAVVKPRSQMSGGVCSVSRGMAVLAVPLESLLVVQPPALPGVPPYQLVAAEGLPTYPLP